MITKQNKTTSQQDRDKRELPQLGKKSTKTKQNKKTTKKTIANFMFNSEKLNAFPLRSGTENDVPLVPFQYHTGSPS